MSVMNALFVFSLLAVIELGMSLFGMEDEVQTATSFGSHSDHEAFLEAFSKKLLEQELAQASDEDNVLISPFSIAKLLSMLLVAAVYDRQIENALQGQSSDLLKSFSELLSQLNGSESNVGLSVVGEIVLSNEFHVLENFTDTLWKFYHSGVNRVNFTSQAEAIRNNINDMVLYKTNLKLPNLLGEGAITSDMKIALLDVAYIEGQWRIPFDVLRTTKEAFYDLDGSKSMVDTMHAKLKIRYNEGYSNGGYTYYIDLPYVNEQFSMGIAVPRDVTWLKALERELLDYDSLGRTCIPPPPKAFRAPPMDCLSVWTSLGAFLQSNFLTMNCNLRGFLEVRKALPVRRDDPVKQKKEAVVHVHQLLAHINR